MSLPFKSLDSVASTGPGTAKDLEGTFVNHMMFLTLEAGSGSHTVYLEGSHDGADWRTLGSGTGNQTVTASAAVRYVRARLDIESGSRTVTATIGSA